uniref:Uncharacterized protein n=1 Tax=Haptolina ericina TaxID=156174 RepID=A0A7S3BZ81_9EUKA
MADRTARTVAPPIPEPCPSPRLLGPPAATTLPAWNELQYVPLWSPLEASATGLFKLDGYRLNASKVLTAISARACPPVSATVLLYADDDERVQLFRRNQALVPELTSFSSVNGMDHAQVLCTWRELGVRFVKQQQGRSFGALACTLTKLLALRWQVRNKVPFMIMLEDDVRINNATLFHTLSCFGVQEILWRRRKRVLSTATNNGTEFYEAFPWGAHPRQRGEFIQFMDLGEVYLSSLEGARTVLMHLCNVGIIDNADNLLSHHMALHINSKWKHSMRTFALHARPGVGNIRKTGHFLNSTELAQESRNWDRGSCMRQLGLRQSSLRK